MEPKLSDSILNVAIKQLNTVGIEATTFRSIATALAISDGHVRYYFKSKEYLLLQIFKKLDAEILALSTEAIEPISIEAMFNSKFNAAFKVMVKYAFIFKASPDTLKAYPAFFSYYQTLFINRRNVFLQTFEQLGKLNCFKSTFNLTAKEEVFETMFMVSDAWIRHHCIQYNDLPNDEKISFYASLTTAIIKPYLNE